jgi:histidinol-phosphatase (PHP family)
VVPFVYLPPMTGGTSAALRASAGFGNYHTHTRHCDGSGEPRDFAEAALRKGMPRLGFSGHNVLPFPTDWTMPRENLPSYLEETRKVQSLYRGRLDVYVGMEVDYIPGLTTPSHPAVRAMGLDFVIGSVHFVGPRDGDHEWTVDGHREEFEAALARGFDGDARVLVERYYQLLADMARSARPDVIGHFDIVKKNNRDARYFSEDAPWYHEAVDGALAAVAEAGSVMEINTGGVVRGTSGALYPSRWILERGHQLGIPVMVNADAHAPDTIDGWFPQSFEILRSIGYRTQRQLTGAGWVDQAI